MSHRIKVRIADKVYFKTINSEEEEAVVRQAIADLNETVAKISKMYTRITAVDIMAIAAINVGIERVEYRNRLKDLTEECERLSVDLKGYVDSLK